MTDSQGPACLELAPDDAAARAACAATHLENCRLCPRDCDVNRMQDELGVCKTGRRAIVSSHFPHFGEEDCLRGWNGSGTIFFAHCNLRCVFCQNFDITQGIKARAGCGSPPEEIADMMLQLQALGCHNINFVTPEHVAPQLVEAIAHASGRGLEVPIVYNTSAYDSLESLALLEGLIDIYMPDFKYWSAAASRKYLAAENYPETARNAILEMQRQVGPLSLDESGLAQRGLLLRHLVMPGGLEETRAILEWTADELGCGTYVNLMGQYSPAGRVGESRYQEINRPLEPVELDEARRIARSLGLLRLDHRRPYSLGVGRRAL